MHDQLSAAEAAGAAGDHLQRFQAFNQLGMFFEQGGLLLMAAHQYERCLGVAQESDWSEGCLAAHFALGLGARTLKLPTAQRRSPRFYGSCAGVERGSQQRTAIGDAV